MRRIALVLAVALVAVPTAGAVVLQFRTPSGNIGCIYAVGFGKTQRPTLRCDIRSGLKPKPTRPRNCDLDWGDSYQMGAIGRAYVTCHGDTAIAPHSRALPYGSTWKKSGFICTSKRVGLRCRNRSGHGFFLSRRHSYRF